ncbi:MAG: collagen-like triple helix repeat-containing protein, partial [Solirubrobacteraceae bacterium]
MTTTGTVTFAPGTYDQNGGVSLVISAAGLITSGDTTLPNFGLKLTAGSADVPAGRTLSPGTFTVAGGTLQVDGTLGSGATLTGGTLKG